MFRLTREVRFAVNAASTWETSLNSVPTNSYGGFPSMEGLGHYFTLRVTLRGQPEARSQYLLDIRKIDAAVRERGIPVVVEAARADGGVGPAQLVARLFGDLADGWGEDITLDALQLSLTPFLACSAFARELPMVRLSQKFEFSATHRLHNPALSDVENRDTFGKCNNPHGHGHNYEVQVTVAGAPNADGLLIHVPTFERIVAVAAIQKLDHKNLNVEVPEFDVGKGGLIASVENIAMTVFRLLKAPLGDAGAKLASVTVWETPKTWCEYSE